MISLSKNIAENWCLSKNSDSEGYLIQGQFGDGYGVILEIRKVDGGYVLKTTTECRTSGPVVSQSEKYASFDEMLAFVEQECLDWEKELNDDIRPDLSTFRLL